MSDLISRDALLSEYKNLLIGYYRVPQEKIHHLITNAPAIEQGEPVAWFDEKIGVMDEKHFDQMIPLYTAPSQPQWVGLSDEEIFALCPYIDHDLLEEAFYRGARATEAKLKELNHDTTK